MTNESNCALAPFCKFAGNETKCTDKCSAFISVRSRYQNANIPSEYADIFIDNSPAKEEQADIYAILTKYVETFNTEDVRIKNLYLYSQSPGTGKTTTSIALLNEYIRRRFMLYASKRSTIPETIGLFLDINELQTKWNLASMSKDIEDMDEIKDDLIRYAEVEFLVIDDVGIRSATEAFRSMIHSVINARVTNGRPTVFTSNVLLNELKTIFDERLYDRIKDQTLELSFKGESKRGRR